MRVRNIDFPESLLASQRRRDLVIFAGAGVSIPPPSNYPDFKELAAKVGSGVLTRQESEPIDRFLGRLHDKGVKIHNMVATILTDPLSQPNPLHSNLLKLFPSPETVRLVTTNFDRHFTKMANDLFGDRGSCEFYEAPALPLGDSFSGIVYLHGSVDKPPERLVLTDRDFGRAYITDGWASIFLQKLFSRYTVLFVGYSHDDTVMNYLARGLPPQNGAPQRFALAPIDSEEHWISLGITPVVYELTDGANKHSLLSGAVDAWAIQAQQGALDQEQRIRTIVQLPPPLDLEAADYVEASLAQADTARFFTRYASGAEWLRWLEDKKLLVRLFRNDSTLTEVDWELASWFAEKFVLQHAGEALSLLRRQGQQLHPILWSAIAHRLFRKEPGQRNDPVTLRRWIPILIDLWLPQSRTDLFNFLLADLKSPEDTIAAIILFEFMTRPIIKLGKDLWAEVAEAKTGEDVAAEVTTRGDEYWLKHVWERFFRLRLATLIDALEPIVTSHLQQAYFLLRAERKADDKFDYLSSSRGQIEDSSQGGPHDGLGVLIDIAYQLIKWNNINRHDRADALISQWFASECLVLKRLAIIGVADCTHWTSDKKLSWLLAQDLIYTYGTKHEVFEVLESAYPGSTDPQKKAILNQVKEGRVPGHEIPEDVMQYERYNLLNWLNTVAPDSALTKAEFDAMQEAHPRFGKRSRPDLDVEFSGPAWGLSSRNPIAPEVLLSKSPSEQMDWLISFTPPSLFGPDRSGLLETVREATTLNHEWGMSLARELADRIAWDSDLWPAVIQAWSPSSLSAAQWLEILNFLASNPNTLAVSGREIASLLSEGMKGASPAIPNEAIGLAMEVSKKLWPLYSKDIDPRKGSDDRDSLAVAINHPAGMLALFWLGVLSKRRKDLGEAWTGLHGEMKDLLEGVLVDDSFAADLARVILASQLTFLFALDEEWTKKHILPMFDWSACEDRAVQAFQGFLTWGRQTEALLPHLLPLYVTAFSHTALLGRSRNRFYEYLAGAACFSSINPLKHGWLHQFLSTSEPRDRIAWARSVGQILRGMQDEPRKALWDMWISEYWQGRLNGVPIPFDPVELGEMVEWSLFLGAAFPSVVERVCAGPAFQLDKSLIYRELDESKIPEAFPSESANMLFVLLKNEKVVLYDLDRVDAVVRRIATLGAPRPRLLAICDELARLGYPEAAVLSLSVQPHIQ